MPDLINFIELGIKFVIFSVYSSQFSVKQFYEFNKSLIFRICPFQIDHIFSVFFRKGFINV